MSNEPEYYTSIQLFIYSVPQVTHFNLVLHTHLYHIIMCNQS